MTKINDMDFMSDAAMDLARRRELPDQIRKLAEIGFVRISMGPEYAVSLARDLELAVKVDPDAVGQTCKIEYSTTYEAGADSYVYDGLTPPTPTPKTLPLWIWSVWIIGCIAAGIWAGTSVIS